MKKEIIFWVSCIVASVVMMDAMLYCRNDWAIFLSIPALVCCAILHNKGVKSPLFTALLCGGIAIGCFFIMILSLPILGTSDIGNIFASSCAIISLLFIFLGLSVDGDSSPRHSRYDLPRHSLSGYTEGDYRFPTDEELKEVRERYS